MSTPTARTTPSFKCSSHGQYQRCIDASACRGKADPAKPFNPVVNVSWNDARTFCAWIGGRLPTEAEWEYTARGGTAGWRYPRGNEIGHDDANFAATTNGNLEVKTVGTGPDMARALGLTYPQHGTSQGETFRDNGFSLYDMAGNVLQWTADWDGPYPDGPAIDPTGPARGTSRILRGGSWAVTADGLRVSSRYKIEPASALDTIGFRCVRDAHTP